MELESALNRSFPRIHRPLLRMVPPRDTGLMALPETFESKEGEIRSIQSIVQEVE